MFLTDATEVHSICGGKVLAVAEPGKPALLIDAAKHAANVFTCGWEIGPLVYEGDICGVIFCDAQAVGFENGFICTNGHSHRTDAEYYDAEEAAGLIRDGYALAGNARSMSGNRI